MNSEQKRDSRGELLEKLSNPCLLNFASGLFALDRAYQVVLSTRLREVGYGHVIAVAIYVAGFLVGLISLRAEARGSTVRWATWLSYAFLVIGSLWLLYILFNDTEWARANPPPLPKP